MTELTLPSFASAGLRVLVFSLYVYTHTDIYLSFHPPSAHKAAHFYPRGCLVDLSFQLARYGPENKPVAVIRALPCLSLFPFFLLLSPELVRIKYSDEIRTSVVKSRAILERTNVQCRVNREKQEEEEEKDSFLRGSNRIAPQSVCVSSML